MPFAHLHCHSHYSLLDGASSIGGLVDRAKATGMNSLALTDHGNLHGALEFYKKAKAAGINPILGYEAYIAPHSRFQKDAGGMKEASFHLTLLAQNRQGFQKPDQARFGGFLGRLLFQAADRSRTARRPQRGAHLPQRLRVGAIEPHPAGREIWATRFGNRPWKSPPGFKASSAIATSSRSRTTGWKSSDWPWNARSRSPGEWACRVVATSDAHYVNREDAEAQDVLLCINTGKFRTDKNRMRMEGDQFYLRAPEEMYAALAGHEDALRQSQAIADSVDIELELGQRHFPNYTPRPARRRPIFCASCAWRASRIATPPTPSGLGRTASWPTSSSSDSIANWR